MTTVAFKDGVFVSDTGSTSNNRYDGKVKKLFRTKYWTLGFSGDIFAAKRIVDVFKQDEIGTLKVPVVSSSYCILGYNHATGKLFLFDSHLNSIEVLDPFFAIGTGAVFAMCALEAGADLKKALQIAIKYDPFSYPPIEELKVKKYEQ